MLHRSYMKNKLTKKQYSFSEWVIRSNFKSLSIISTFNYQIYCGIHIALFLGDSISICFVCYHLVEWQIAPFGDTKLQQIINSSMYLECRYEIRDNYTWDSVPLLAAILAYYNTIPSSSSLSSSSCHQAKFFHRSTHCFPTSFNIIRWSRVQQEHNDRC